MKSVEFIQLMAEVTQLSHYQRNQLIAVLNQHNDNAKTLDMIESSLEVKNICPRCGCTDLYRHGLVSGLQRYRCKKCHKTFNALTGTPLAHLRYKPKWLTYLEEMRQSHTVRKSAANAGVHRNTSFRWRHRFLTWISQDRPAKLHGITEADETYLLESNKGQSNLARKARKRGGTASKPGLSGEQVCILVVRDRAKQTLDFVVGTGSLTKTRLTTALKPVLDVDVLLVSDANPIYTAFCESESISHEAVNLSQHQRVKGAYHVQNVNAYHSRFKWWLERFHGVATKYLPNYLGWRRAFEQHRLLTPEMLLSAALGNFQYLTVT